MHFCCVACFPQNCTPESCFYHNHSIYNLEHTVKAQLLMLLLIYFLYT